MTAAIVAELADRAALTELVIRLYVLLDEERFDELGSVYAPDAVLEFPSGRMEGLEAITAMARTRAARYGRMQHVSTDVAIELDGDRARLRSNHLSFNVAPDVPAEHFDAGIVHRFEAARTGDGWRFVSGGGQVVWTAGDPR